jgi:hypothetical protein
MTEIHLKGKIVLSEQNSKQFIDAFNQFLTVNKIKYSGNIQVLDFDDVEVIEETDNNAS